MDDRCDLCGTPSQGSFRADFTHLRESHPGYARGLILRMSSPLVFLAAVAALAAVGAPQAAYVAPLVVSIFLVVVGTLGARRARAGAGLRSSPPLLQVLRQGGFRFLLIPAVFVVLLLLSRH